MTRANAAKLGKKACSIGLRSLTVAVPLKILAAGVVMYQIHPAAISFLLAVAMSQIDPLSVDTLLEGKESMSEEAQALLRIWAAFDDPMTVLFGFLILMPVITGISGAVPIVDYLVGLALSIIPALLLWLLVVRFRIIRSRMNKMIILFILLAFAFITRSYLLAALAGLMLRPLQEAHTTRFVSILYYTIIFVVGMSIASYGVDLRLGFLLAIVQFFVVQPSTAIFVFRGTAADLLRIAFAQQNGLTTLLMGIAFQSLGFDILPMLLPAIIFVNLLNLIVNRVYRYKEAAGLIR